MGHRGHRLQRANAWVRDRVTDGSSFVYVGGRCVVAEVSREFQVPSLVVAMGASMFQRAIWSKIACDSDLEGELLPRGVDRFRVSDRFEARWRDKGDTWPLIVYLVCVNLALKTVHYPRTSPRAYRRVCFMSGIIHRVCCLHPLGDVWTTWLEIRRRSVFFAIESWVMRRLDHDLSVRLMCGGSNQI
jgi:hypothetical protein